MVSSDFFLTSKRKNVDEFNLSNLTYHVSLHHWLVGSLFDCERTTFKFHFIIYLSKLFGAHAPSTKLYAKIACHLPDEQIISKWIRHGAARMCVFKETDTLMHPKIVFNHVDSLLNLQLMINRTSSWTWLFRLNEEQMFHLNSNKYIVRKSYESSIRLIHFKMKSFAKFTAAAAAVEERASNTHLQPSRICV